MNKNTNNDDVILEPETNSDATKDVDMQSDLDDSVIAEDNAIEALKKLKLKLKQVESEKTEYLTGWQRAKADLINARKRDEESHRELAKYANESLIADLLPVLDSFDMAMANKESWEKVDKNWRVGVEYIVQNLRKTLEEHGLKEINPIGEKFDVMQHESVDHVKVDDKSSVGKVVEVVNKGFSLNGKIIKVPKVKIGE